MRADGPRDGLNRGELQLAALAAGSPYKRQQRRRYENWATKSGA
jgi:hypothetical protein